MNDIAAALLLGLAFRQLYRFQMMLAEFSRNMAVADGNKRKPIEYQNMMTPRWLTALFLGILACLIYVAWQHASAHGWQDGLVDVLVFAGGFFISGAMSSLAGFPSTKTYVALALKTLTNREADFGRARDAANVEKAAHFRWLLSTLTGLT